MPVATPAADLVRQLSRAGLRPDERLVGQILDLGDDARAALIALATDIPALHAEVPACLGPLHALRLLGELAEPSIIAPLLNALPVPIIDPEDDIPASMYANEILHIIGRVGAPAVPVLWEIADDEGVIAQARGAAANALAYVATYAPEVRDAVIAEARRRLTDETLPDVAVAGSVALLAEIGDAPSYKAVMAAYRAGKVDQSLMPAAAARQFLLGGGRKDLACVRHPFWERYDEHGPTFKTEKS
ncbi:hypothetical protein K2Z83_05710 [Oscillochloris sp. ZM17-4]|uniref:hypothetical protein n=1 Tax=Oscillochloris sp. ZM17-4 TaxID=2866714 RepID=UPI001C732A1C|nr:hypothetical protein [Oscillochloris sp. ZM17-4]MBX0327175.1 hypothetical protein [Oscillochloris sp. ZM17-4]